VPPVSETATLRDNVVLTVKEGVCTCNENTVGWKQRTCSDGNNSI